MRDAGFEFCRGAYGFELVAVGEYCRCGCGDTGFGCRGRSIGLALDADAVGDGLDAAYFGCRCGDAGFGCHVEGFWIGFGTWGWLALNVAGEPVGVSLWLWASMGE